MLTEITTSESYYLDNETYEIIEKCINSFVNIEELFTDNYEYSEFIDFIHYLINNNILIKQ